MVGRGSTVYTGLFIPPTVCYPVLPHNLLRPALAFSTKLPTTTVFVLHWICQSSFDREIRLHNCKHGFVKAVIRALQAVHAIGIAHLDVRLENICWDDTQRAVLIDFDRSAASDALGRTCVGKYGASLMYPTTALWTERAAWKVDYRQLASMIGHIDGNNSPHSVPPPTRRAGCVCTSSGWFQLIEPHRTYTTALQGLQGV